MSTAQTAEFGQKQASVADESRTPLPMRADTFLGVFEAIGNDLGINPNWLRVPFAALILWNPVAIIAAYLVLGAIVALSRWMFPATTAAPDRELGSNQANDSGEDEEERLAA